MSVSPMINSLLVAQRLQDHDTTYWPSLHPTAEAEIIMAPGVRLPRPAKMPKGSRALDPRQRSLELSGDGNMQQQAANGSGVLWIDAVGGYLVTLKDELVLGQAQPEGGLADIMIQADVSRKHARLRRVGEDYLIEPLAIVRVGGQPIVTAKPLVDGDLIGLGDAVQLRFRKSHPLSNTARLDLITGQRLQPFVDGVILMGETCILGRASNNHVCCAHWDGNLILSRTDAENLRFRADERVEIDGTQVGDKGSIGWDSRMTGKNFAITLERM